jgi:5-(carboxyamino)imidazole ribonucleotide synthase
VSPIYPGATLGVLGSGQLGRMFAIAARRLGYRVHVYSPDSDTPTGQVADLEIDASYEDHKRLAEFARGVQVVTFEFENVPSGAIEVVSRYAPCRPSGAVLHTTQHRLREKSTLAGFGAPVTPFRAANNVAEIKAGLAELGTPAVLKTASWGYDGKGQAMIRSADQAEAAFAKIGSQPAIVEAFIDYQCELSIVGARGVDGQFVHYGPFENSHANHILDVTICPARVSPQVASEAVAITRLVMEKLEVVGILCVEFFLDRSDRLMINETAPRPHNSGHLTIDAHVSCQFEQQVRAICALPLGSAEQLRPAAMANLLGDVWLAGQPNWAAACALPNVKLHLYGKQIPKAGRKMGHLTALGESADLAHQSVVAARTALSASK